VKAMLHRKVMLQSMPALHVRYHNTPNRYSSNRKRIDSIDIHIYTRDEERINEIQRCGDVSPQIV
jgi:hypothetical protein